MSKVFTDQRVEEKVVVEKKVEVVDQYPVKPPELKVSVGSGLDQLWSFVYKRGPAAYTGVVRAGDAEKARLVAVEWGERNGVRIMGAAVKPMILADESILNNG